MERFKPLIEQAKANEIHKALGFKSWPQYISDVVSKEMGQLPPDDRRTVVALLAVEGMSQNGIATALGVNPSTIGRDRDTIEAEVLQDATPVELDDRPETTKRNTISIPMHVSSTRVGGGTYTYSDGRHVGQVAPLLRVACPCISTRSKCAT
jgi:hypothetical protein